MEDIALLRKSKNLHQHPDRPTWSQQISCVFLFGTIFMFAVGFAGLFAISDYVNGNAANAVVTGYFSQQGGPCIWTGFPILTYTISGVTYVVDNYYAFYICGDYQSTALSNAQRQYPLGMNISLWYLHGNPQNLANTDPRPLILIMIFSLSMAGLMLLIGFFLHFSAVCCCGASTCCCKESATLRCCDPYA